jgi:hypothetical protein
MGIQSVLRDSLPEDAVPDPDRWAYELVPAALDAAYGSGRWNTERRPKADDQSRAVTWIVVTGLD